MTILAICVLAGMFVACRAAAAADARSDWLTPEGVRRQLEQLVSIRWSGVPLKQAVQNLAVSQRVAIVVDRRIDPDQEIELTLDDVSLSDALNRLATGIECETSRVGPVVYLGPPTTARRLRTLVELKKQDVNRLPPEPRARLNSPKRFKWETLSTPRELVAETVRQYQTTIDNLPTLPHDLWPSGELPPMSLVERLSLLAANFDLTFEFLKDGEGLHLVPMPEQVAIEKSYRSQDPSADIARLDGRLTRSEIAAGIGIITIRGPAEELEQADSVLLRKPARPIDATAGKKVYQLTIVMPVGRLIKELGPKLGLEVKIDEDAIQKAGLSLDKEATVSIKNASEDQLLRAVLEPVGLTFTREGATLVVHPK